MTLTRCIRPILILAALTLTVPTQLSAAGKNTTKVTKTMKVAKFHAIDVSSGITVNFIAGNSPMKVTGPSYALDYFEAYVKSGELNLSLSHDFYDKYPGSNSLDIIVQLTSKQLDDIEVSSGATVNVTPAINTPEFDIEASSGGIVNMTSLTGNTLEVDLSSGGVCNITTTKVKAFDADLSSGGIVNLSTLEAPAITADCSSGSAINVMNTIADAFTFDASSGSVINMRGKCTNITADISSGSCVKLENLVAQHATLSLSSGSVVDINAITANVDKDITSSYTNHHK